MGKYTRAINLQRQAIRLRKEAAGLDTRAGIADWLANNWGRLAAGGALGWGTYKLTGLLDPKNKNRGIRAALSAIAAGLMGTKGYDWAKERWADARTAVDQYQRTRQADKDIAAQDAQLRDEAANQKIDAEWAKVRNDWRQRVIDKKLADQEAAAVAGSPKAADLKPSPTAKKSPEALAAIDRAINAQETADAKNSPKASELKPYVRPWQKEGDTGPAPQNAEPEATPQAPVADPTGFDAETKKLAAQDRQARLNKSLQLAQLRQRLADKKAAIQKRKTGVDPLTSGNKLGDMTPAQIAARNAAPGEIKIGPEITKEDVKAAATAPVRSVATAGSAIGSLWNAAKGNIKAAQQAKKNAAAQKEQNEIKDLEAQIKALEGK